MGWRLLWAVLAGTAAELAGVGLITSAAWLITRAAEQPELVALSVAIVGVRTFATSRGIFRYGERLTGHDVALRAQAETRERLYEALIPPQSPRHGGADLLSRMVDDTEAIQDLLVRSLLPAAAALITATAATVIGLTILPTAALVLLAGFALAGVALPAGTAVAAHRWAARIAPARAALAARTADVVHGSADLAAYGATERAIQAAQDADADLADLERRQARVHAAALALGTLIQGATVAAIVLLAQRSGVGTIGTAVLALLSLVAFEPVLPLAAAGERLAGILSAVRRLREVRATRPAVSEPVHAVAPPSGPLTVEVRDLVVRHAVPEPTPSGKRTGAWHSEPEHSESEAATEHKCDDEQNRRGQEQGQGQTQGHERRNEQGQKRQGQGKKQGYRRGHGQAGYGPAEGECEEGGAAEPAQTRQRRRTAALDGVSLTLTPGKRVALVGPSGAGKSTLLAALMRLVEPEAGTIRVNGVNARDLDSDRVREMMTGLTQDPYLFQTTVRGNLRLAGPEAGDEELAQAVRKARLDAWIERVGWDAELGEDAKTVSGGQLQRLALARALLNNPPVLLLDEPAEALDEQTADALMADLLDATAGRTTLLVTHRLTGLEQVDEIIVLEQGRVVQRGTHEELSSRPGYYRDLWESEALTRR